MAPTLYLQRPSEAPSVKIGEGGGNLLVLWKGEGKASFDPGPEPSLYNEICPKSEADWGLPEPNRPVEEEDPTPSTRTLTPRLPVSA